MERLDIPFFFWEIFFLVINSKNFIYFYLISSLVLPNFLFDDYHEILSKRCKWKNWIYCFLEIFSFVIDSKNSIYFYLTSILVLPSFSLVSRLPRNPFKWKDWIYQFFFFNKFSLSSLIRKKILYTST